MRDLVLLWALAALGSAGKPVVFSYGSSVVVPGVEAGNQGSLDVEDNTSQAYKEQGKEDNEQVNRSQSGKELLQPRFFTYSDRLVKSEGSGEPHGDDQDKVMKGGGTEHTSTHELIQGNEGEKGYKDYHKFAKGQKGVHDKESHKGKYSDSKGVKGKKKEEGGHFGLHHHEEKGRKAAKYGESGEHKKGHHTKGEHNIHKKDEYVKKHEFYDEHHEGGEHEKNGGFHQRMTKKKGKKKRRGHRKWSGAEKKKGKKAEKTKSSRMQGSEGYSKEKGQASRMSGLGKFTEKGKTKQHLRYNLPKEYQEQ